ncbi:FAD-binding oxidoreductase [Clostridium sp. 'deep sea']|uniref:NAD(P)/FAD-dependent oxidoreductase n=1 Tax=Clostridium sp. 'deep sea' TaxID=2779445 RepID=UPI001896A338|nr:FAD-binding oxidoreductase [Clostridium sp. 'deep sea']QOR34087.1 FAD-binding oxidoreductase [Clostridium sp. 'deep sea']
MKSRDAVIIGGGVIGCAIAYELAKRGMTNITVVEKNYLASGATGRCGAGVRQQWGLESNILLSKYSCEALENMNVALDYDDDIEFKQGGYLLLAYGDKMWNQFLKNVELQHKHNVMSEVKTPKEAKEIVPYLNIEGLTGATFYQKDGHANPFKVTDAYYKAAKRLGVEFLTFTEVTNIIKENNKVTKVVTTKGEIATNRVINAAGGWSNVISNMVGVDLPVHSERHQILVTEPVKAVQGPMVMSFHHGIYCQQSPHGSFIMGLGDPNEPRGFNIDNTWQFMHEMAEIITDLLPPLKNLRVIRQWSGMYNVTPDAAPILGSVPDVEGFYLAVGFSGHGFMIAPMTAQLMAEHILGQKTTLPISIYNLDRYKRGELIKEPNVV